MKCTQTSEHSNKYRAWGVYSTGTLLTFSPQNLCSGSLLRASLWTRLAVRGRDPAVWSAIQEDSLCTSMSVHASMGLTANTTTNNSTVFSGNKSQIIGDYKPTSKHKANICCEFLMHILACHKCLGQYGRHHYLKSLSQKISQCLWWQSWENCSQEQVVVMRLLRSNTWFCF